MSEYLAPLGWVTIGVVIGTLLNKDARRLAALVARTIVLRMGKARCDTCPVNTERDPALEVPGRMPLPMN